MNKELKEMAGWFRGYLDSLMLNESITKQHIAILQEKIEELLEHLDDADDYDDEDDSETEILPNYFPSSSLRTTGKDEKYKPSQLVDPDDDLPF